MVEMKTRTDRIQNSSRYLILPGRRDTSLVMAERKEKKMDKDSQKFTALVAGSLRTFSSNCFYFIWEIKDRPHVQMRWGTDDTVGYLKRELTRKTQDYKGITEGKGKSVIINFTVLQFFCCSVLQPDCRHRRGVRLEFCQVGKRKGSVKRFEDFGKTIFECQTIS